MRRRRVLALSLLFVAIAAVAAYVGWAVYAGSKIGRGWTGLRSALPYLLAGVVTVEVVIAAFVWLAFYSQRRGYDDRAGVDHR
jgi:cation transporter-like permease